MGAVALTGLLADASTGLDLSNPNSWIPPPPAGEDWQALAGVTAEGVLSAAALDTSAAVAPPPLPPVDIPTVDVVTQNAFGNDPFDANGCPILSPSDLNALATLPYRSFSAILGEETELPPLPEGYDVMPLATSTGIFVETEDVFRFRAISTSDSVAVSFFGRVQRPSGYIIPFNHTLQTSSANTTFTTQPVPGKGILLGAAASVPIGSITTGQVSAVGEIGRIQGGTFTPHTLLFSGQLDDLHPLSADSGQVQPTLSRPTFLSSSSAGPTLNFITITVTPASGKRMRFIHGVVSSTSTAAAGDRVGFCIFRQGGVSKFRSLSNMPQGSSSTVQWSYTIGANGGQVCSAFLSGGIPVGGQLPESLYFYDAVDVLLGTTGTLDSMANATIFWEES